MAYDQRALVGVSGWLAFFIVTLALSAIAVAIHAILLALSFNPAPSPQLAAGWHSYVAIMTIVAIAQGVGYGYAAWRLSARTDRDTPRVVIMLLWALALVPALLDIVLATLLLGLGIRQGGGGIRRGDGALAHLRGRLDGISYPLAACRQHLLRLRWRQTRCRRGVTLSASQDAAVSLHGAYSPGGRCCG